MKFLIFIGLLFTIVQGYVSSDCNDISKHCSKILKHCKTPAYLKLMEKNCALSCRFCSLPTKPTTKPIPRDRIHHCLSIIEKCNDIKFKEFMEHNCKRTCSTVIPKLTTTTLPNENVTENIEASGITIVDNEESISTTLEY